MMKGVVTHNNRTFYVGQQFKHFKGKIYKIVAFCTNAETQETLVIYRKYGHQEIYARSLTSFASEVNHEKYPNIRQHWRFEPLTKGGD